MLLFDLLKILFESPLQFVIYLSLLIVPLIISVTVHEWAHGFAAYKFGDNTPKEMGRLTLNPLKHIDPVGALMLFIIGIGWAKPVPINPNNIRSRLGFFMVSIAGVLSNFILAVFFSFLIYFVIATLQSKQLNSDSIIFLLSSMFFYKILDTLISINLMLGLFNLLPVPPLDGANIIRSILPDNLAELYFRIAPFGLVILMVLIFSGGIKYISYAASFLQNYLLEIITILMNYLLKLV